MSSRPRAARGTAGRDGNKEVDTEADRLARIIEGVKKAKEFNDHSRRLGLEILSLEEEIKTRVRPTLEQARHLDELYRENLRNAEGEKKALEDFDPINNLAIFESLRTSEEPVSRNGGPKSRKGQRPTIEVEAAPDSPGPSPNESRIDILKRVKSTGQRSSSVASQARSGAGRAEDSVDANRGIAAEKAGQLIIGMEVFYKFAKGSPEDGAGIQCVIKKVWQDKKPIVYDVQDPEPDASGKQNVHKATAKDLIPIPASGANLPVIPNGSNVYARYPETDTFYKAKVRGFQKGLYTLKFEGEEDDKEMTVDKRFVLELKGR